MSLQTMGKKARNELAAPQLKAEDIRPQSGPQEKFLSSHADIAIYGGSAGSGKTMALLMEAARNIHLPTYSAVIFRRTHPEITAPGGMWPESMQLYPHLGGTPNNTDLLWKFPSGAVIKFGHMQYVWDVRKWLGSQVAMIGFDQLEVFEKEQFWYMLSRNRSMCGIRPYIRATANPQPGWLADLLAWWIDPSTGFPIKERSGILRWFVRAGDDLHWADSAEELREKHPKIQPKSITFIGAKLADNKKLMEKDPGYEANLDALPRIERMRLKDGNWLISNAENEWPSEFFEGILFDDWPADLPTYTRVMSLDPSKGKADASGDYSAWIMMAVDPTTLTLWVDADLDNTRPVEPLASSPGMRSIVTDGIELFKKFKPCAVLVEVNGFQELVAHALLRRATAVGQPMAIYTVNQTDPKAQRIVSGIDAILAQRRLKIKNTPGGRMLLQQLRDFKRDQKPSSGVHDDGCFVAGTMIDTSIGAKPIETVRVGDFVLTRKGYRRVLASGCTGVKNVIEVTGSDGVTLIGTGNHPVFNGIAFTPMHSARIMYSCHEYTEQRSLKPSFTTALHSVATPAPSNGRIVSISLPTLGIDDAASGRFIRRCGKMPTGRYQRDARLTTSTEILSTMSLRIWSALRRRNTISAMLPLGVRAKGAKKEGSNSKLLRRPLESGMAPKKVESGTRSTESERGQAEKRSAVGARFARSDSRHFIRPELGSALLLVSTPTDAKASRQAACRAIIAGSFLRPGAPTLRSFAQVAVCKDPTQPMVDMRLVSVSAKRNAGKAAVYNLTVEGESEYFANGFLVHNCDALAAGVEMGNKVMYGDDDDGGNIHVLRG